MSKGLIGAAGGLSAEDREKLVPENIRYGVDLFAGTSREVAGNAAPQKVAEDTAYCSWNGSNHAEAQVRWTAGKKCRVLVCIYNDASLEYFTTYPITLTVNGTKQTPGNFMKASLYTATMTLLDLNEGDEVVAGQALHTTTSMANITASIYVI